MKRRIPVELRTGYEGLSPEELLRVLKEKDQEISYLSIDLDRAIQVNRTLEESVSSLRASQSLSSSSGILNLRLVNEEEELKEIAIRLIRSHLELLSELYPSKGE